MGLIDPFQGALSKDQQSLTLTPTSGPPGCGLRRFEVSHVVVGGLVQLGL